MNSIARVSSCLAAVLLAACGGSQPPIAAPGAMPQSHATTTDADLLYVSNQGDNVYAYTYPGAKLAETLTGFSGAAGLCSDGSGNLYVVNRNTQNIVEYAHGGQTVIKTLSDFGNYPNGCAVDPSTGNLAVAGGYQQLASGNLAIFANAQGSPTVYQTSFFALAYCTYDDNGDAFADANVNGTAGAVVELANGGNQLTTIALNKNLGPGGPIQWDGKYVAVASPKVSGHPNSGPNTIFQVAISGGYGKVVNTISLSGGKGAKRNKNAGQAQFWIQGSAVVVPRGPNGPIGIWKYPAGGRPTTTFSVKAEPSFGLSVSVAPSR